MTSTSNALPLQRAVRQSGSRERVHGGWTKERPTALLVLNDGTVIEGRGFGAEGSAVGEVCFNTAMTGYQEILTDPSYAGQIITFTFPHIGNTGTNEEDIETSNLASSSGVEAYRPGLAVRAVELPGHPPLQPMAQGARHHRARRDRRGR